MNILLDMDGVLSDWVAGACMAFGVSYEDVMRKWPRGSVDFESALGIGKEEMWRVINALGEGFWADMPETPWARRLYDGARKAGPVFLLTSPSNDPPSLSGKLRWMQRFTGNPRFRDYLIGPRKELCAGPNAILVDDDDRNLAKFSRAGGRVVCFPRPWNHMHDHAGYPCDYALSQLVPLDPC